MFEVKKTKLHELPRGSLTQYDATYVHLLAESKFSDHGSKIVSSFISLGVVRRGVLAGGG